MTSDARRLQLDLPLILPTAPDAADSCVKRLINDLSGRDGMENVHIIRATDTAPAKLCLHYRPDTLSLSRVREIAESAGARITERYGHVLWRVAGVQHQRRARTVEERLKRTPGVIEAEAVSGGVVKLEFDRAATSEETLRAVLSERGISIDKSGPSQAKTSLGPAHDHDSNECEHTDAKTHPSDDHGHDHGHGGVLGKNTELYFALLCGGTLAVGFIISRLSGWPSWAPLAFYLASYLFGGFYTLKEAIDNLRMRRFEIDTLMLVAAAGAVALGEWAEGALLLFLFSIGHALESFAMGRARRAIEALSKLAPSMADVKRDGQISEVPVEELVVGDTVVARSNARVPADGFVTKGTSSVDQAPVTGESIPVDKQPVSDLQRAAERPDSVGAENRVFAGTINGSGVLEIYVTKVAANNTLVRVVRMVSEAEAQKSPTQLFTDRFERIFVPSILGFVFLLLFAWTVIDEPFRESFYRAMAVLVAASPCALAIATPSAVLSGVARAARGGVLIKGGGPLETLGMLAAIAFDKTGTLTEGKPKIMDVVPAQGTDERAFLAVAIAVEKLSDHPLAAAVVRDGQARLGPGTDIPQATNVRSITGRGVSAEVDGEIVHIGKKELFSEIEGASMPPEVKSVVQSMELRGRTTMVVRQGQRYLGVVGLMDTPRPAARQMIERLRQLGITRILMLSGDNTLMAQAVAKEVGLDEAYGDLMPEDKVKTIQRLRAEQKIAMVGDGVNDAPAMANAHVGIAMGAAGSDVALETADVALMADDLNHLPFVVGLSRQTRSIIRQNLWMSLGMVAFLIPATLFGLQIGFAVLLHEGSTLVVVMNALRLLAYRDSAAKPRMPSAEVSAA